MVISCTYQLQPSDNGPDKTLPAFHPDGQSTWIAICGQLFDDRGPSFANRRIFCEKLCADR